MNHIARAVCLLVGLWLAPVPPSLAADSSASQRPAFYVAKPTWHETLIASRVALRSQQRDEAGRPFISGVFRGGDGAHHVKVRVAGWRELYLIVDDAGDYSNDVANWAEAKLVARDGSEVFLDTIEPVSAQQAWGSFKRDNKSTVGGPMQITERRFSRGLGTHARSVIRFRLDRDWEFFEAWVGIDVSRGKEGSVRFIVANSPDAAKALSPEQQLWELLARDFSDPESRRQMRWEREDRIWEKDWSQPSELAERYARATRGASANRAVELAHAANDAKSLAAVRAICLHSRAGEEALAELKAFNFPALRLAIEDLAKTFGDGYARGAAYLERLNRLEKRLAELRSRDAKRLSLTPGFSPVTTAPDVRQAVSTASPPHGKAAEAAPAAARARDTGLMPGVNESAHTDQLIRLAAELRALSHEALLANPLLDFDELLLVRRRADRLGLPQNWQGNSSLPRTGYDNEIAVLNLRELLQHPDRAPTSQLSTLFKPDAGKFIGDLKLHFDADRLLFSSIGTHDRWQVFELRFDPASSIQHPASSIRQVTPADLPDVDHYDACYLADDRILFCSTACFAGVPCVDGSDHVANLYRLEADGHTIRQLCLDQDHNWSPTMLANGRVLYQRWEYADTPHAHTRLLFHMNPDGTGQCEYYGSNSYWPNAVFYARPLPGHPTKVVAIVGGHHGVPRMGELVIFDPAKGRREADGAVQRIPGYGKKVEPIIKDQLVDDSWPKFLHPFPLNEHYFLVSAKPTPDALWGIYLVDVFDNLLLLAELPGHALLEPTPLRKSPRPPVIPDRVDPKRKDALVYLQDIYQGDGLKGVPRGAVKSLRVFAYHWAFQNMGGLLGTIGLDGPWDVRRILGTVPVEADGSAYFRVPANTPISVQPLDAEGKALQLMRSWFTAMPGENLSCVGCHERQNSAPLSVPVSAFVARKPSEIQPWLGPPRGFNFAREVQPVLDRHCVSCHDGQSREGKQLVDLRGVEKVADFLLTTPGHAGRHGGKFSVGYANLHRFVRRPGIESDYHLLTPLEYHADTTELVQLLKKGHYAVKLDAEAWDRLVTWIDLNAPYHGSWGEQIANASAQCNRRRELRKLYAGMEEDDPENLIASVAADVRRLTTSSVSEKVSEKASSNPSPSHSPTHPLTRSPALAGWPFDAVEAARRQAALGPTTKRTVTLAAGITLDLVLIPTGEFIMGDENASPEERPTAPVRITKPFWMARAEISNEQFAQFEPTHDSHVESKNAYQFGVHGYPVNEPQQPVVRVSWEQAMAFCRWLSAKTGERFALPTEAQWEWAARAGTATPFSFGDPASDFSKHANLSDAKLVEFASDPYTVFEPLKSPTPYEDYIPKDTRFHDGALVTARVGSFAPNAWGLHDLHGNVWEWTLSAHRPYPYRDDDGRNALDTPHQRVVRGGSWRDRPHRATSAYRLAYEPWQRVFNVGFRVVCEGDGNTTTTSLERPRAADLRLAGEPPARYRPQAHTTETENDD
jgi:formylglycine-generating enzyme required for sulfatase activity